MKKLRNLTGLAAMVAVVLSFLPGTEVQAAQDATMQGTATVRSIKGGSATYKTPISSTMALSEGLTLAEGAVVSSGAGTTVTLDLGVNGQTLVIKPNSVLAIDSLKYQGSGDLAKIDTQLDVQKGSILGNVKKLSDGSNYSVKTARGTAGIRGTVYVAYAIGIFQCADGSLLVTLFAIGPQGPVAFVLEPGQSANASDGTPNVVIREMTPAEIQRIRRGATRLVALIPIAPIVIDSNYISPTTGQRGNSESTGEQPSGSTGE